MYWVIIEHISHSNLWEKITNVVIIFQGATGAKILQKHELNNGMQAWARKEQFEKAQKVHTSLLLSFSRRGRVV